MSFLAPGSETEPPQEPAPNRFGNLKSNPKARGRRGGMKFFDSADWAMKNADAGKPQDQPVANPVSFTQMAEGEEKNDGESPLFGGESVLGSGESPLGGGDSPLAG